MNEDKKKILEMLAQGKISADEAGKLLDAVSSDTAESKAAPVLATAEKTDPKFLRVLVESSGHHGRGKETVNVRIPFQLLRAGVKLAALIPGGMPKQMKEALAKNGIDVDWDKLKGNELEEVIQHLSALQVDVDSDTDKVRVFCEW